MTNLCKRKKIRIRLYTICSLIFFVAFFLSCHPKGRGKPALIYNNGRAVALSIPDHLLPGLSEDSLNQLLIVHLANHKEPVLGTYTTAAGSTIFTPVVPFSTNKQYEVSYRGNSIATHTVIGKVEKQPTVVRIFPASDTLPENLLKLYIRFSQPMREGISAGHVNILNEHNTVVPDVFLDLQPELWNADRTVLTLWLDPGRIKRGLQPNERLGNPLKKGSKYILKIDGMMGENGKYLQEVFTKGFTAGKRDEEVPQINGWNLSVPQSGSLKPLIIDLNEPLDHFLLLTTITITNPDGKPVKGSLSILKNDREVVFKPFEKWKSGYYVLTVSPELEDLAGNNLNRPFDRDLSVKVVKPVLQKKFFVRD